MKRGRGRQARGGSGRAAARRRFAEAQRRRDRARTREAQQFVRVICRLDFSTFNAAMKQMAEDFKVAARRMADVARAMRCTAPGCQLMGTMQLAGRRVCPNHFMCGTGTGRPRGILDAAREARPASGLTFSVTPHVDLHAPHHLPRSIAAHLDARRGLRDQRP